MGVGACIGIENERECSTSVEASVFLLEGREKIRKHRGLNEK